MGHSYILLDIMGLDIMGLEVLELIHLWSCLVIIRVSHTDESDMDGNPDLLFTPNLPVVQSPAVCCVWKGNLCLRPWTRRRHLVFPGCYWLIFLLGDVQRNSGPISFSCTVCRKAVTSRQNGVECTRCERWTHASCGGITMSEYRWLRGHEEESSKLWTAICRLQPEQHRYHHGWQACSYWKRVRLPQLSGFECT